MSGKRLQVIALDYLRLRRPSTVVCICVWICLGAPAYAHGFGMRYDLPLPLSLWIVGAASTVMLSFLLVAIFYRWSAGTEANVEVDLLRWRLGRLASGPAVQFLGQALAIGSLVVVVVAGLIGDQTPTRNFAPTAIWIAWWVGFSYLSAFVGDVWSAVNPWSTLFNWYQAIFSVRSANRRPKFAWPEALGAWPAMGLFFVFAWIELIWDGRSIPSHLAWLVIGYSVITWTGMYLVGSDVWLRNADPFALAFGVLARFAPTAIRDEGSKTESGRKWILRPPAVGLLHTKNVTSSLVGFIIVMLSTVTFDGLMATPFWQHIENVLYASLPVFGDSRLTLISTLGLLSFCGIFAAVYRFVVTLVAGASRGTIAVDAASRAFVLTLVPIAIAYLVAHYSSYFLIQGQLMIRLISDPLGFGWNLFGSAQFRPDIGIVGARFIWYTSVIAIVLGHVVAVFLAHIIAVRSFPSSRAALRSQIPMLTLMVGYTMMSLWIIAQPIVE
jgi:hypothetical protein